MPMKHIIVNARDYFSFLENSIVKRRNGKYVIWGKQWDCIKILIRRLKILKSAKNIIEKNGKKNDEIKILHIAICFVIILFGIM